MGYRNIAFLERRFSPSICSALLMDLQNHCNLSYEQQKLSALIFNALKIEAQRDDPDANARYTILRQLHCQVCNYNESTCNFSVELKQHYPSDLLSLIFKQLGFKVYLTEATYDRLIAIKK